jgi:hypothetical protein
MGVCSFCLIVALKIEYSNTFQPDAQGHAGRPMKFTQPDLPRHKAHMGFIDPIGSATSLKTVPHETKRAFFLETKKGSGTR